MSAAVAGRVPRRVLLVQTQAEAAGAQEISRLLAAGLSARGHDVHQLFFFRRTAAFDADPNATVCLPARPRGPLGALRLLRLLFGAIRRHRPDAVVTFQHFGNLLGAPIARLAGVRTVIANHNGRHELLHPAVVRADRWLGLAGAYSAAVVNSEATAAEYDGYPARYRRLVRRIDHGFGPKDSRLDRPAARASLGLPAPPAVLLGGLGRLAPTKNLGTAVRLLALRPGWHLALAGQGEAEAELRGLAGSLGCADRLHLVGELAPERVGDFLRALDVFVFPSRTETFGLAAAEAASAGVPVVANDLPVLREVLSAGGEPCAVFADAEDPAAFAAAVDRMLDPAEAARFAARGRSLASRFPLDAMVDGYERLLERGG